MKKAILVLNLVLIALTGIRVWHAYHPAPPASGKPATGIEAAEERSIHEIPPPAGAPDIDAVFGIHPETGGGEKGADAAGSKGKKKEKAPPPPKPKIKPSELPQVFGLVAENGEWAALLRQDPKKGADNGAYPAGYARIPQGGAVEPFHLMNIGPNSVTFGLGPNETHIISLFDFDRKWLRDPETGARTIIKNQKDQKRTSK